MATRDPGLQFIAEGTGEARVTVENCSRVMTVAQVPVPYNTSIGRGNRQAHLSAEWLCSTFLALVLADPKNAPVQVPAIGNLRMQQTLAVNWRRDTTANALNSVGPKQETTFTVGTPSLKGWLGETVFDLLVNLTKTLAMDWGGPTHEALRKRFSLTIRLGLTLSAEMELWDYGDDDGTEWWTRCSYGPPDTASRPLNYTTMPITRQAVIETRHIQMLASIYADTLKHEAAAQAPAVQFLALDAVADADASPTNENGALPGAPPTRNQDHNSIPEGDTPEARREREKSQASSSCGPGRPRHSLRTTIHGHPDSHPSVAAVA